MKASRTWLVWASFAICAATILAAMTWQTRNALASERDRAAAEKRAALQEMMRLALWRMDSLGASLILEEINENSLDLVRSRFTCQLGGELTLQNGGAPTPELRRAIFGGKESLEKIFYALNTYPYRLDIPAAPPLEPAPQRLQTAQGQKDVSSNELKKRAEVVDKVFSQNRAFEKQEVPAAGQPPAVSSLPRPVWIGDELFLLSTVSAPARSIVGSWIDLPALKKLLLSHIRDLLPTAKLIPAKTFSDDGLLLASFPLRLEPGPLAIYDTKLLAVPSTLSLVAGWSAAAIAIFAASLLVFGIMRLSERRASFVSAVTHELRTPLTTFRLYSDMLESGAVKPEKRGDYLRVLSREADRLSHLVENVLAFSRIERGSARSTVGTLAVADLLEPMRERFQARLASAEMTLEMKFENPGETIRADAAAIEHILFNLVDNAAKYAAAADSPVLEISTAKRGDFLEIHVSDHGPGIADSERRRIFRAFHKSAREAAESRPGVGLGLALSRRLARGLGGDLRCAPATNNSGACFIVSLPV